MSVCNQDSLDQPSPPFPFVVWSSPRPRRRSWHRTTNTICTSSSTARRGTACSCRHLLPDLLPHRHGPHGPGQTPRLFLLICFSRPLASCLCGRPCCTQPLHPSHAVKQHASVTTKCTTTTESTRARTAVSRVAKAKHCTVLGLDSLRVFEYYRVGGWCVL